MSQRNYVVLGTRGSDLARTQARMVEESLRAAWPDIEVRTAIITTHGDETAGPQPEPVDRKAGRKGLFTSEIERALLTAEIDIAVHSAKDLPSEQAAGLEIAATLRRAAAEDVLVTKASGGWGALCARAVVATGSVRRRYQLQAQRPDLHITELRGNVPTRLRKLGARDWDAIVLARAGLDRLGFDVSAGQFEFEQRTYHCAPLPSDQFVSAGGQGIIALQVRSDDAAAEIVRRLNHAETLLCLHAEREFLRLLDGDCDSPVGVFAQISGEVMTIRAQVFRPPSVEPQSSDVKGPANAGDVAALAAKLMEKIDG